MQRDSARIQRDSARIQRDSARIEPPISTLGVSHEVRPPPPPPHQARSIEHGGEMSEGLGADEVRRQPSDAELLSSAEARALALAPALALALTLALALARAFAPAATRYPRPGAPPLSP